MTPFSLACVPDWFLSQQQIKIWHDDVIIAMMMRSFSGTMVIKDGRLKKPQLKKS